MTRAFRAWLIAGAALWSAGLASPAAALTLTELEQLQAFAFCEQECSYGSRAAYDACLEGCGTPGPGWDADQDGDVDGHDYRRALRDFWGQPDCAGADAGEAACLDEDGDGLRKWEEAALGTLDAPVADGADSRDTPCADGRVCGFASRCVFVDPSVDNAVPLDRGVCRVRQGCEDPQSPTCTAFHLELVEETDEQVVVHLYFDHAPVDARVLDLYVTVPRRALRLTDSRPLPALLEAGKTLEVRKSGFQTASTQELRVIVFGTNATRPIPTGAIAELVFSRVSPSESGQIAFARESSVRRRAMAPDPDGTPGDLSSPLEADHLWGEPVTVTSGSQAPKLALYYSFDSESLAPNPLQVPDPQYACDELLFSCDAAMQAEYAAMQQGVVEAQRGIEGVSGPGVFLDGISDHLEMPVVFDDTHLADDDFSLSFWFYHEGDGRGTGAEEQLLFAHNTSGNKNGYGVVLRPASDGTFALEWFDGDRANDRTRRVPIQSGLPARTWLYFALTMQGHDGAPEPPQATLYLRHPNDDSLSTTRQVTLGDEGTPADIVRGCLTPAGNGRVQLVAPLRKPEAIFYASAKDNLYGLERIDPNGMAQATVLRDTDSTALDPDYHPGNRKLVFVSSRTGDYEVWISDVDGSNARQVTSGFGSTAAGRFVRHPRWSPDGTAIVFEANAYSAERRYNTVGLGYQLYYVGYNPRGEGSVEVPQASGDPATVLDFRALEQNDAFYRYTLTGVDDKGDGNRNNFTNAHWLGNGRLVATRADARFDEAALVWLDVSDVPDRYRARTSLGRDVAQHYELPGGEVRLLAAGERDGVARTLFSEEQSHYEPAGDAYLLGAPQWSGDEVRVTVTYTRDPRTFDRYCWDRNGDRSCDLDTEDPNHDYTCDELDCQPAELRELYVWYDEDLEPVVDPITGRLQAPAGPWILAHKPVANDANAALEVASQHTSSGAYLTVQVLTETSAEPIPQGTLLGTLRFRLKADKTRADVGEGAFTPMLRRLHQDLMLAETGQPTVRVQLGGSVFERVQAAAFSPDLSRLVVSGIQDARPVVATSDVLDVSARHEEDARVQAQLHNVSSAPMRVEGLSWASFEAAFNCNWMGAYREPTTGLYKDAFRGGLDEVRYHDFARSARAVDAEFARGLQWLEATGRTGALPRRNGVCSSHMDCAPYEQCWDDPADPSPHKRCAPKPCTSQDDCGPEGSCRLMPVPVSQARPEAGEELRFVCAVDCTSDIHCAKQECLNGPCMFCQAGSCAECQRATGEFGMEHIEGCPDRNSFACEEGSCVSECYSFENNVSRYLCDPATEYCRQGKCALIEWDWSDFSPATFSGMGEMLSVNHGNTPDFSMVLTSATAQFHTVQIEAYGVSDYLNPPELLVEVHAPDMYGGDGWASLGRVRVHNKTLTEAQDASRRYRVTSPYPFDALRIRLVIPPYSNLNGAATGLGARLAAHCQGDALNCAARERLNPGSRAYLGYRIGIPEYVARAHREDQGQLLPSDGLKYLYGGQPAVLINRILVGSVASENDVLNKPLCVGADGSLAAKTCVDNRVCKYQGGASDHNPDRVGANGVRLTPAPVRAYGDTVTAFDVEREGYALLNCAYNPVVPPGQAAPSSAELLIQRVPPTLFVDKATGLPNDGKHQEAPNACFVQMNVGGQAKDIPCYETYGSDPNLDPYNLDSQAYRTLDIDTFQSFGYGLEQVPPATP